MSFLIKLIYLTVIFFTVFPFTSVVYADSNELPERAKALDKNSSGFIEIEEAKGPLKDNFSTIDKDKSGGIDGKELSIFFSRWSEGEKSKSQNQSEVNSNKLSGRAAALDKNKNNVIDKNEAVGPLKDKFNQIDTNKDLAIDYSELTAFFGAQGTSVAVDTVIREPVNDTIQIIGQIVSTQSGSVAAKISGPVKKIFVKIGDKVKQGQTLAMLSDELLISEVDRQIAIVEQRQAMVATVEAELEKILLEKKRIERLKNSSAFSKKRSEDVFQDIKIKKSILNDRKAQLAQAIEQLNRSNINLKYSKLLAPYNGVIINKNIEVGSFVNIGSKVFSIINDSRIEALVEIPKAYIKNIKTGDRLVFLYDDNNKEVLTEVRAILPSENPLTRSRQVRLKFNHNKNYKFSINESVIVKVPIGSSKSVLTVHKDAIVSRGNGSYVFVVENNTASEKPVILGSSLGNRFIVDEGLNAGNKIVIRGNESLKNKQRVRVIGSK